MSARAAHFFVHFFPVTAQLHREVTPPNVGERKLTLHDEFFSLLLNLGPVPKKLISGKITYI